MGILKVNVFDAAIVIAYMLLCIVIGVLSSGKIRNLRDYTLGSKPFTTTVMIATTFATAISAHKTIGSIGKVYTMGLVFIVTMFFIPIGWFVMAKLLSANIEYFHQKKFLTLGDIMEHYYGKPGRWVTSFCAILFTLGMTAASSMAIGKLLYYFFNISEMTGMFLALAVVTLYSMLGGIRAVAFTDLFQFLVFFIALPVACAIGYSDTNGLFGIIEQLPLTHLNIDSANISLFLGMAFFSLMPNADIPFIQRALASKNVFQLKKTFNSVAILMYPLFIIIALIGIITYIKNPDLDPDIAFFYFIAHYLPNGMIGLVVAGVLAIIMSTQDSFLNSTTVLIARDICKQLYPKLTPKQELTIARFSCIIIALLSAFLLFLKKDILDLIWFITNFWDPLVIVPLIVALIGIKVKKMVFVFLPITVLSSEYITSLFTGAFDTRSFSVGMIVSLITLLSGNKLLKIYKRGV